jgi:DNA transformation protein and related proteins
MATDQNEDFLEFVLDQLSALGRVSSRPMFGCFGLYSGEDFFAIIDEGRLYFCTDEATRPAYRAAGMKTFHALKSYYEVPVDVLEDDVELCKWAREAVVVHRRKKPARNGRRDGEARTRRSR